MRSGKYPDYKSSLVAYLQFGNIISDNNLSLNLCIVPTTYYVIIILNDEEEVRSEFLVRVLW